MESQLIHLLVVVVIVGLIFYGLSRLTIPNPWNWIIQVIVGLIVLIYLLRLLGALA